MQILDFAMQMEKDGEEFYRSLAADCPESGLRNILVKLADVEVKHFKLLKDLKEHHDVKTEADTLKSDVKTLFGELLARGEGLALEGSQVELYKQARDLEIRSRRFYLEKADETESEAGKSLFHRLATEEKLHEEMLDSIIEFVSRPEPGNWLENAEWYHSEEY